MPSRSLTVLGAGNTAFSVAANLTLKGIDVTLFEISGFEESLDPIRGSGEIFLEGCEEQGAAAIKCITTDPEEAVNASDLLLLIVPAYAHKPFAEVFSPHLLPEVVGVFSPSLAAGSHFGQILKEMPMEQRVSFIPG